MRLREPIELSDWRKPDGVITFCQIIRASLSGARLRFGPWYETCDSVAKNKEKPMFEVLVTYRPDFREEVVERCAGLEDAQAVAQSLSRQYPERFVRVWIRRAQRTSCNT